MAGLAAFDTQVSDSDFIEAANHYDRAEHHMHLAKEYDAKIVPPEGAPEAWAQLSENQDVLLSRGLADVQGMHALVEGEYWLECGAYPSAATYLDRAISLLESADELSEKVRGMDLGEPEMPSFASYARALRQRTATESHLIEGSLEEAAESERKRGEALRETARQHAASPLPSSAFFRRRAKRDELFARERAQVFEAAASRKKKPSLVGRVGFLLLAFAGIAGFLYLGRDLEVLQNPAVFVFVLLFAMVLAAIVTGLTSYKDGERTLTALASAAKEKTAKK